MEQTDDGSERTFEFVIPFEFTDLPPDFKSNLKITIQDAEAREEITYEDIKLRYQCSYQIEATHNIPLALHF